MAERVYELGAVRTLQCSGDGKRIATDREAVDVIGEALQAGAALVVIPVERLEEDFFRLKTGKAGAIVQKFVQYRRRVAIVGDVSKYVAESSAFAAFVREANRGEDIWFLPDFADLQARLGATRRPED